MSEIKIGLCQMMVEKTSKQDNIEKARNMIISTAEQGAEIVVLPEMFNCPYNNKHFREYGEGSLKDETLSMLSQISKEKNIYLIGGSIPELHEGKVYNSSFIFNNEGKLIGKHRKMHLFDIDIKNKIKFKESEVLTPGDKVTIIDTKWGKMGVAICYDIRFPELTRIMALEGAKIVFIPAAFNMTTGPVHWDLSFRARALDNQIYMVGVSPARNVNYSYVAYGNSLVVDPWGKIINKLDEKEGILVQSINLDYIDEVRESLPLLKHRRTDLYKIDYEV
ncbi:carbon-nitrogen hydrolase family protein [Clostridium sp. P21]|uniref:Carbon-nitrogen hydrolase family protein n=1 Tax=Clostridium muellerianum TaxID=2716538 RepID=A0A7Y0EKB6_9CLOT|nr:carbon-nitrogen hydrolase family protein [Clostridium muellerianum]NMM64971.1 carbon-nitrogen hydrolase family protein [Clostridium muellerianum]